MRELIRLERGQTTAIYRLFTILVHHKAMGNWQERFRASGIHLTICMAVAAMAGALVFGLWYPYPYREISGGRELFLLIAIVDVIIGPLITLAVFNTRKPRRELRLDLAVIGLLQIAALSYGLWTVALARPVHLVFEVDRFRVVHAVDVPEELLSRPRTAVQSFPWSGPTLLAVRPFRSATEEVDATLAAIQGLELAARPDLWQPYETARGAVLRAAKPVAQLKTRFPLKDAQIDAVLKAMGRDPARTAWLPMVGRKNFWTAFVDPATAQVVGFMPLDSF